MKAEKDWAAERILRKEAVRLDLNEYLDFAEAEGSGDKTPRSWYSSDTVVGVCGNRG